MKRKDYVKFANMLNLRMRIEKDERGENARIGLLRDIANDMCYIFSSDNEHFNVNCFMAACFPKQEE